MPVYDPLILKLIRRDSKLLRSAGLIFRQIRRGGRRTRTSRRSRAGRAGTIVIIRIGTSRSSYAAGICIIVVIAACRIAARRRGRCRARAGASGT